MYKKEDLKFLHADPPLRADELKIHLSSVVRGDQGGQGGEGTSWTS